MIRDHLGSVRVTFSDIDKDAKISYLSEIQQENHYYPFGLNMEGPWSNYYSSEFANRYQYNSKELNSDVLLHDAVRNFDVQLGLNDYGARLYDPAIGRFTSVDRFAEKYSSYSRYF